MIKTLAKKQLSELKGMYFRSKKSGEALSKGAVTGLAVLYAFIYISLFLAFFGMSSLFANTFLKLNLANIYFSLMGVLSLILGIVGSVFTTYTSLYVCKDNDLLLSLPIKPSYILLSRMLTVYFTALIFSSTAYLPALLRYYMYGFTTLPQIAFSLLTGVLLSLYILAFVCALGFLISLVAVRIKSKAIVSAIFTVILIAVYYFCYFRMNAFLKVVAKNPEKVTHIFEKYLFVTFHLGNSAAGKVSSFAVFFLVSVGLFALCLFILSKTFIRIATTNTGEKKNKQKAVPVKAQSSDKALLKREFTHFLNSPAYMLNMGLGLIIIPIVSVVLLVKSSSLQTVIDLLKNITPKVSDLLPVLGCAVLILLCSVSVFSAPSISLEGKNLWILKSSPIPVNKIFNAKKKMHIYLLMVPAVIAIAAFGISLKSTPVQIMLTAICVYEYVNLSASAGLFFNLKMPNFSWTNETVPIKQSAPVAICMFGGWAIAILMGAAYFFFVKFLSAEFYIVIFAIIFMAGDRILSNNLNTLGVTAFEEL